MTDDFFDSQTNSSRIKANIVAKYFPSYCRIINRSPQKQIIYLDLFAGPGIYGDGNHSTPMLIGKAIAEDDILKNIVQLMFNDNKYIDDLKGNFEHHFPLNTFYHKPRFGNKTVGDDENIKKFLTTIHHAPKKNPHPTLLFFDPWGYKGINTSELAKFMQNWGNEIFLFVNIKRIHAAIKNQKFDALMALLFPTTIDSIKKERRYKATVSERLNLIMDRLVDEFRHYIPGVFHTSFKFQEEDSKATSHFVIHFTKHSKGFELVKQVYHDFDNLGASLDKDGTYTFDAKRMNYSETSLGFDFTEDNLYNLRSDLVKNYKGRQITAQDLFEEHQIKTNYCATHYAKTLRKMAKDDIIDPKFTDGKEHRVSVLLTKHCILKFK